MADLVHFFCYLFVLDDMSCRALCVYLEWDKLNNLNLKVTNFKLFLTHLFLKLCKFRQYFFATVLTFYLYSGTLCVIFVCQCSIRNLCLLNVIAYRLLLSALLNGVDIQFNLLLWNHCKCIYKLYWSGVSFFLLNILQNNECDKLFTVKMKVVNLIWSTLY